MELKEGMYVRTKKGIGRVTEYTKHKSWGYIVKVLGQYSCYTHTSNGELSDVIKASYNLIDLIEIGDYVNGEKVTSAEPVDKNDTDRYLGFGDYDYYIHDNEDVKDVVTKEQFNSMKYVLEKVKDK